MKYENGITVMAKTWVFSMIQSRTINAKSIMINPPILSNPGISSKLTFFRINQRVMDHTRDGKHLSEKIGVEYGLSLENK